jgi:hypothetical protein
LAGRLGREEASDLPPLSVVIGPILKQDRLLIQTGHLIGQINFETGLPGLVVAQYLFGQVIVAYVPDTVGRLLQRLEVSGIDVGRPAARKIPMIDRALADGLVPSWFLFHGDDLLVQ